MANRKLKWSLEDIQAIAVDRGGRCLEKKRLGLREKWRWECSEGHRWQAAAESIIKGHWCRKCAYSNNARRQLLSLDLLREIARQHSGECLSSDYYGLRDVMRWKCAKGHEWEAKARNIREGKWCPICAGVQPADEKLNELRVIAKSLGGGAIVKYLCKSPQSS